MRQSSTAIAICTFIFQIAIYSTVFAQCPEIENILILPNCETGYEFIIVSVTEPAGVMYSVDNGANYQVSNTFYDLVAGDYLLKIKKGNSCSDDASFQISQIDYFAFFEVRDLGISFNCDSEITLSVLAGDNISGKYLWYLNKELIAGENNRELLLNKNSEVGEYFGVRKGYCRPTSIFLLDHDALEYYFDQESYNVSCNYVADFVQYSTSVGNASPGQDDGAFVINVDSEVPIVFSLDGGNSFDGCNHFGNLEAGTHEVIISNGSECMEIEIDIPVYIEGNDSYLLQEGSLCRRLGLNVDYLDSYNYQWYKNGLPLVSETSERLTITKWDSAEGDIYYASFSSVQGDFTTGRYISEIKEYHTDLGEISLCRGDTIVFHGIPFYRTGVSSFKTSSSDGCDSTVRLDINIVDNYECEEVLISGSLFYDVNRNGVQEIGEFGIPDLPIVFSPQDINLYVSQKGKFGFVAEEGATYNIGVDFSSEPLDKWDVTTDQSEYSIVFEKNNPANHNLNIGLVHNENYNYGKLSISPIASRCNTEEEIEFSFRNLGAAISIEDSLRVSIEVDPIFTVLDSFQIPITQNGNIYSFQYHNLSPFQESRRRMYLETPSEQFTGEHYIMKVVASIQKDGETIIIANHEVSGEVRCSYDPNDKQVSPVGVGEENYTLLGEKLTYTVRFQNTGNDVAYDVHIKDDLDENLDVSTFKVIKSSHEMTTTILRNELEFSFFNINLRDSTTNGKYSHGYVIYEIQPREGIEENTLITNTASIFFDQNPPIITNTTMSLMVESFPNSSVLNIDDFTFDANLSDNREVFLDWSFSASQNIDKFIIEKRGEAREWLELDELNYIHSETKENLQYIDRQPLEGTNYYRLQKVNINGSRIYSELRSVEVDGGSNFVLYPNPISSGQLLTIQSETGNVRKCTIKDKMGRTIIETGVSKGQKTLSLDNLIPGVYLCELEGYGFRKTFKLIIT